MLVFDCETRTDKTQALTFGSYRFLVAGRCLEEGLFYADDLAADERNVLEHYAREHPADTDPRGIPERGIPSNPRCSCSRSQTSARCSIASATRAAACSAPLIFLSTQSLRDRLRRIARSLPGRLHVPVLPVPRRDGQLRPSLPARHRGQAHGLETRAQGLYGRIDHDEVDRIPEGALKPKDVTSSAATCSTPRPSPSR